MVAQAVCPEVVAIEWRERLRSVADEASDTVTKETEVEDDEEVVDVPKRFVGFSPNLRVS